MIYHLLLLHVLQGESKPQRIDSNYIAKLNENMAISPRDASILIAWKCSNVPLSISGIPRAATSDIEKIVNRIKWPDFDEASDLRDEVDDIFAAMDSYEVKTKYIVSLALLTTAWDLHENRKQFVVGYSGLSCVDKRAKLIEGKRGYNSTNLSTNWPWRFEKNKFRLGKTAFSPVGGGILGFTFRKFVSTWLTYDRKPFPSSAPHF